MLGISTRKFRESATINKSQNDRHADNVLDADLLNSRPAWCFLHDG